MRQRTPMRPERLRIVETPFGWVPFRLLTSGLLAELSTGAKLLYFFLCLVSDPKGLSFYGDARIEGLLGLSPSGLEWARDELCRYDLLAFEDGLYQVLSLPGHFQPLNIGFNKNEKDAGYWRRRLGLP